jgi:FkbH-like protein
MSGFPEYIERLGVDADFMLVSNPAQLSEGPPRATSEYDFQIVQIPLRFILNEHDYFRLSQSDTEKFESLLERCKERIRQFLDGSLIWNVGHGIVSFIYNFMVPQQNPMGRLLPRYDLRNMVYFVEKLNESFGESLSQYGNCYLFDFDSLVASLGRRYYQGDAVLHLNHGAQLTDGDFERDKDRLEGPFKASDSFPSKGPDVLAASWNEMLAMYRTIRRSDQVRLVILDLENTLWRGFVPAAEGELPRSIVEGWPLGLAEALHFLRHRGVLLAAVSTSDESRISGLWQQIYTGRLLPTDFAAIKVNGRAKIENIADLLLEFNVPLQSVLFIDDDPLERAAVERANPGIRTLGGNPLLWRRVLLWAAETQVAEVPAEPATSTEVLHEHVTLNSKSKHLSRERFLQSLAVTVNIFEMLDIEQSSFAESLNSINKNNQFNVTGQHLTLQECLAFREEGARLFAISVRDRFTTYGVVGLIVTKGAHISRFVMSCRVAGLDVEIAALAEVLRILYALGFTAITAAARETDVPSSDVYKRLGFTVVAGCWERMAMPVPPFPAHIRIEDGERTPMKASG